MTQEEQHEHDHEEPSRNQVVMSKAASLAMELSKEKRRLTEELAALQAENDTLAPVTPRDDASWRLKWLAVILGVVGIFLISADLPLLGTGAYFISGAAWTVVGAMWNDKAIMIGSAITTTAVAMKLLTTLI